MEKVKFEQESAKAAGTVDYATLKRYVDSDLMFLHATLECMDYSMELHDYEGFIKADAPLNQSQLKAQFDACKGFIKSLLHVPGLRDVIAHHLHNHYLTVQDHKAKSVG